MNLIRIVLESGERQVLAQVVREVIELVSSEMGIDAPKPRLATQAPGGTESANDPTNPAALPGEGAAASSAPGASGRTPGATGPTPRPTDPASPAPALNAAEQEDFRRWSEQLAQIETDDELHISADPALLRLFPPASHSDPDGGHEFRGLTQKSIADDKLKVLASVLDDIEQVDGKNITLTSPEEWVRSLTDCRLVLASRLGIASSQDSSRIDAIAFADEGSEELEEAVLGIEVGQDPDLNSFERIRYTAQVYSFFGSLQESILQVMRIDRTQNRA
ncbi:DUF2017 family protein [Micrococcales bacterium 31B]|nr:DUF2017 family protein [Micrococcales bacterium 31B]